MSYNLYTAVTIGPISETMALITKPAALWAASVMFSTISRLICEKAVAAGVDPRDIITPYYPTGENGETDFDTYYCRTDGVGLFHDHIIVKDHDGTFRSNLPEIKDGVLETVAGMFNIDASYLRQYVMMASCTFDLPEGKNPILHCGKMLDCLELSKVFPALETENPFLDALGNEAVKETATKYLNVNSDVWQLSIEKGSERSERKDNVRDLPHIARACKAQDYHAYKKSKYYCILRADGDNMGKIIESLKSDDACREFSHVCLNYCSATAAAVGAYGGVTIYAGGDDLFAIVPCEGDVEGRIGSVFELIGSINRIFAENFKKYIDAQKDESKKPALSFGLFICYEKYPLYEAVRHSDDLLFGGAKRAEGKNCIAVRVQKHSGQSQELLVSNACLPEFVALVNQVRRKNDDVLMSAAHKVLLYELLLNKLSEKPDAKALVKNLFKNVFDADFHRGASSTFVHDVLPRFFTDQCCSGLVTLHETGEQENSPAKTLAQTLRLMKFFVEKGDA